MSGGNNETEREIQAEQGYLDWVLQCLDVELDRTQTGPWNGDGPADRALGSMRAERAAELRVARYALLIGRLDIAESSEVAGTWYVGRTGVATESYDVAMVDWRSELGGRFYQAGHGNPLDVGRRRTFGTNGNAIRSLSDEVLIKHFILVGDSEGAAPTHGDDPEQVVPEPAIADAHRDDAEEIDAPRLDDLRAPDLLLVELERDRTEHMHEIVTTIQADQDRLIRRDPSVPLIVQGGPGTGKTVVGLHRAAYLLYRQREGSFQQSMLIVGPNSAFMDYIGAVLPTLGETNSRQLTTEELLLSGQRASEQRVLRGQLRATDTDAAATAKGSPAMAAVVKRAVWAHAAPAEVSVSFRAMTAKLDGKVVHELIKGLARSGSYGDGRKEIESRLARALTDDVVAQAAALDRKLFTPDVQAFTDAAIYQLRSDRTRNSLLPAVTARSVLDRLLGDSAFVDTVAGDLISEDDRRALHRTGAVAVEGRGRHRSMEDLALLDEIADVIGAGIERFDHLILDEAQDLSPMQWRAIQRRTRAGRITILGDLAQGTAVWSPDSWEQVRNLLGFSDPESVQELRLGYRVPKPILDYAARLLPVAAPDVVRPESFRDGEPPQFHRVDSRRLWDAALLLVGAAGGKTALIVPSDIVVQFRARAASQAELDTEAPMILPPEGVKGLEFDQVVVVEPAGMASHDRRGYRHLYVALTRSTKRLDIVHSEDLPSILSGQLPGAFDPVLMGSDPHTDWSIDDRPSAPPRPMHRGAPAHDEALTPQPVVGSFESAAPLATKGSDEEQRGKQPSPSPEKEPTADRQDSKRDGRFLPSSLRDPASHGPERVQTPKSDERFLPSGHREPDGAQADAAPGRPTATPPRSHSEARTAAATAGGSKPASAKSTRAGSGEERTAGAGASANRHPGAPSAAHAKERVGPLPASPNRHPGVPSPRHARDEVVSPQKRASERGRADPQPPRRQDSNRASSAADQPRAAPAGWHRDPAGRYWYRWWGGVAWTAWVSSNGRTHHDPKPIRTIP